ncbi:multiple monosaccharide ABC transporter substrate-binding protein [Vagococcus salmoninarum]|uniref:multiple monosaccharide ABC transporter substrate-binding protein n=1 Tax=Vagococcus salmoninarum TaxID=2739 RepID=UPI00187E565A|nr:multiple monosaccharide ABC transporter substrate-binding protein [Vagococcus salmoninarum]MBE9388994.1 sugar-binding protein [Vagococcus salmoninarum]
MRTKKIISSLLLCAVAWFLVACAANDQSGEEQVIIGVAMPSKAIERWDKDGSYMEEFLVEKGYEVDLQYAQDDVPTQVSQIENMITKGVSALVIAAIDGEALTDVIEKATNEEIPVLAYDRLIMNADGIDYYATFDNFKVGELQGQYLVDALELDANDEPRAIELFGGAPDDNNSHFFFDGAFSVLEPYMTEGKLVIRSQQQEFSQIATLNWDGAAAQARMDNLLSAHYADDEIHGVLAPNDALATGIISSLKGVGYGSGNRSMPIITGQDAEVASVKSIIDGEQAMTVFKNTQTLADLASTMIDNLLNEEEVEINDLETYHNNLKIVPTYMLEPVVVTVENYQELLIDSDYISQSDLD